MNILHLEASPGWGGQEMRILKEAIGMRSRGHFVFFLVSSNALLKKYAMKEGFKVFVCSFEKKYWIKTLFTLKKILKAYKIDLINTHSSLDAWIGGIAGKFCHTKVLRTRHLSAPIRKGLNSRVLYNYLADHVVTTCKAIADVIVQQSRKPEDQCISVPTGVNPNSIQVCEEQSDAFRRQHGVGKEDFLVGMVCFMRSWKGVKDFIFAANSLRELKSIKWVIIGGGHEKEYRNLVKELHLEEIFFFTGHMENPFPAIGALDVFSLLSTGNEGVSQASLQAAYLMKPLITTSTGGLKEVCIDEQTGYIVPSFSPERVADKVLFLRNHPHIAKAMGERARNLVLNHFTEEQMLDEMEAVYQKMGLKLF